MVVEGFDDADGEILRRVREEVGSTRPVVATFDIHANLSQAMAKHADVLIGYETYPHVDAYDRGFEATAIVRQLFDRNVRPTTVLEKLPLLSTPQAQNTSEPPMQPVISCLHEIEADARVVTASVAVGFPYADVPRAGMSVLVTTWAETGLAARYARSLRALVWDQREAFRVSNIPPEEAVRRALRSQTHPVILVDVADNIGGGAPGDGTVLLKELLAAKAQQAVVTIADHEAVAQASAAGIGAEVVLRVGAKTDNYHGMPLDIRGRARLMSTGEYVHRGSYMTGQVTRMGRTVVLDCDGLDLVLMERKAMPFDAQQLRSLGIEPATQRVIVVKSAVAWRAAYGDVAREVIYVDTPGVCTANLNTLPYRRVPRPIFPLDAL
jgi:microcystin degradation protein MlrC